MTSKLDRQRKMERRRNTSKFRLSATLLLSSPIKRNYVSSLTMFDRTANVGAEAE